MSSTVYLSLGSNLGERFENIDRALDAVNMLEGTRLKQRSSYYETEPLGEIEQPDFINIAAEIETSLAPGVLLAELKGIEKKLGREKTLRWGPRTIDIDILFYGEEEVCEEGLQIPHSEIEKRRFVLEPLTEIAGNLLHPISGKSIKDMRESLHKEVLSVKKVSKD